MREFILTFDIPRDLVSVRKKVHRDLIGIGAERMQHSFWKTEKLDSLIGIAIFIKKSGGDARILEERFVF